MSDEEWSQWFEHDDNGMPASVTPDTIVQVKMLLDGDVCGPHRADFDGGSGWRCPLDPVAQYRIRKPRGLTILENLIADLPAPVQPPL
jgi:hypothetical protein